MKIVNVLAATLAAALALGVSSLAQAQGDPLRATSSCFRISDMRNHSVGGDRTLYLDVGGRAVYRAEMSNRCLAAATSSDPLILRNRSASQMICSTLDLDVAVNGSPCIVASIAKLTPPEVAALPKTVRP